MRTPSMTAAAAAVAVLAGLGCGHAADLIWEVENPFRFYKVGSSFALHERAFAEVRGSAQNPIPADIVSRMERRLNAPDCGDPSTPASCAATQRSRFEESRLGWAAKTLAAVCYDGNARPRRYLGQCERKYSWGAAKEDYILPEAHTVTIGLSPERRAEVADGPCVWTWQPRAGGKIATRTQPCARKLTVERVPFAREPAASGIAITVKLPDGRELSDPSVIVDDVLIAALGDSFASGESNPDRPVTFSAAREMVYDPVNTRDDSYHLSFMSRPPAFGSLPKRMMEDEGEDKIHNPTSREFLKAFDKAAARWLSPDCHRSQYGYPVRVALQLALEDRHRAVTLVHLACSGAEVTEGLFVERDAREQFDKPNSKKVPAQFDQLSDLICRGGASARSERGTYALPFFTHGDTRIDTRNIAMRWCPPERRKRPIDLVLLSVGGNDVGFSGLAAYAITESASDLAPIVGWIGQQLRFGPQVARAYLDVLDERLKSVRDALRDGFGIAPSQVVQTSYEPIHFDETGAACGALPTLGLDVHPSLKVSRERVEASASFSREVLQRLQCITKAGKAAQCPGSLSTGPGTGFTLVTEHLPKFERRGFCARDPSRLQADGAAMAMPRKSHKSGEFEPYSPAFALPYAPRWRLVHTPNDAFLTANTHREGISPFDILQPAYAGLYSGALHPTAEGHAIVADHVLPHVRAVLEKAAEASQRPTTDTGTAASR